MPDSPAAATPYEILGVSPTASQDELRRAYRRLLRHTHPDVGGSAERFHAVQIAWERVGTPASRAEYDRHRYSEDEPTFPGSFYAAPASPGRPAQSGGVRARMYGHPGGQTRQHFLSLIREWAGRGTTLDDPYDPALVRTAPREIRHRLAKAIAEESTAQLVSGLGIGFTAWHDVDTEQGRKLDHVVLGPAGLFAILSEDWGAAVQLRRGELIGDTLAPGESPIQDLEDAARALSRSLKVRFTALVVVLPDGGVPEPLTLPRRGRRPAVVTLPRSRLVGLLRDGLPGMHRGSFEKVFELRSRLQNGIRFVQD